MKTTVVRGLIEESLRRILADRQERGKGFRLRDASFRGKGLRPQVEGSWERLRDLAYEGRGGVIAGPRKKP